jgi:hypothetical protein
MAAVTSSSRPILMPLLMPRLSTPCFAEANPSPASTESSPVEEEMIYRGARCRLAHSDDCALESSSGPVAMTYRGTAFSAPASPTCFPFGQQAEFAGMIYRGARSEG